MDQAERQADFARQNELYSELLAREEELHPDLAAYLYEDEDGDLCFMHPLLQPIGFPGSYDPRYNAVLNHNYGAKSEALAQAEAACDWQAAVFLHHRPYRIDALMERADDMHDNEFWNAVGAVWIDSENIHQDGDSWRMLLGSDRPGRENTMDEVEQAALAALPDTLTVFRGCTGEDAADGFSWTLDRAKAEWFANRYAHRRENALVVTGTIDKVDVIAHFLGRNETEIVCLPESVRRRNEG